MDLDTRKYWIGGHKKYLTKDWIDKPSIFATTVINHFPSKGRVLDLGAGQGQDSRFFAANGYKVVATDFSDFALQTARKKAEKENLKINFLNVDISKNLPFRDNAFEVVYSHLALHYWDEEDTKKIFKEIYRILKPDGIFAALFNSQSDPEIKDFKRIGTNLYFDPKGLVKSYWTANYLKNFIKDRFKIILLDDKGITYKDSIRVLVRFVGQKAKLFP